MYCLYWYYLAIPTTYELAKLRENRLVLTNKVHSTARKNGKLDKPFNDSEIPVEFVREHYSALKVAHIIPLPVLRIQVPEV